MNRSLTPKLTNPADRKSNASADIYTRDVRSVRVLDEIMAEPFSMKSVQENQLDPTDVFDGKPVNRQIPAGVLENQYFRTLRQARHAALATARQFGTGYTIKQHANPAVGTGHLHVVSPTGKQVSGHFFYGEKPRFIPKTQNIPAHRRSRLENDGRRRRELEQEFTAQDVIHPNIDVYAQYAIQRMLKSPDPNVRADASGMLAAVKSGQLRGIYKEDQQVPAMRAKKLNKGWWQVIPQGEDAILFLDQQEAPLIVFRDSVRSNAARLDPALLKCWQAFKQLKMGNLNQCQNIGNNYPSTMSFATPVNYVVPAEFCVIPTQSTTGIQAALDFFCKKTEGINLKPKEITSCFDAVQNAMIFLKKKAPANNRKEGYLDYNGQNLCESISTSSRDNCSLKIGPWPPSRYSVIKYKPLQAIVERLKCALDKGYIVRTGVLSGRCNDNPGLPCQSSLPWRDCPEHYLLILGYEDNKFIFWDWSGPNISSNKGCNDYGFGVLHFDPINNRLSTAEDEDDMVVHQYGGDHIRQRNGRDQKRYQVLSLYSGSYRDPIKPCGETTQAEITLLDELLYMSEPPRQHPYRDPEPLPPPPRKTKPAPAPSYDVNDPNRTTYQPPKRNPFPGQKSLQFQQNRFPGRG